jgi:hypothetical protein
MHEEGVLASVVGSVPRQTFAGVSLLCCVSGWQSVEFLCDRTGISSSTRSFFKRSPAITLPRQSTACLRNASRALSLESLVVSRTAPAPDSLLL